MLKKKQQAQQLAQPEMTQVQTEAKSKKANKVSMLQSKLATRILILVLFIMLFGTLTFAWYQGIPITFQNGLDLSTLSSLKDNVDVIGYSFNEEYDENDPNSSYLTDVTFKTETEMNTLGDTGSKNLFAGDYFEPGAINKLNRSDYATTEAYEAAVNDVIDANTNTKYIKVTNRSDMDIAVKILFTMAELDSDKNDLSGFWYLLTDVTSDVNSTTGNTIIEKLSTYASANKASRDNDYNELNVASAQFEKLTSKVTIGTIEQTTDTNGTTKIYRLDYGLCESALRSSGSYYNGKKVKMNVFIYYGQTNAPDSEDAVVETTIRQVGTAEELTSTLNNLKEAFNGDTIQLTADITIDGPLTITRPFNFDLNGHRLTINGGDLTFSYNSSTAVTIDCTKRGSIHIIGKRSTSSQITSYDGSLIINTPNSPITFIGDNANTSGVDNYDLRLDGVGSIVNYSQKANGGLTYTDMYTVQYTYDEYNNYQLVQSETKITLEEDACVTIGSMVNIDLITSDEITQCSISNYGNVGYIYLPNVNIPLYNNLYLYIYNNGKIGDYTGSVPKTWDVQLPTMARPSTTQVIKDTQSNDFTIGGSTAFKDSDITDLTDPNTSVVPIANEDNAYKVYLSSTTQKTDNSKLKYVLLDYFNNNEENFAGIKKLVIIGTKGCSIDQYDINYLMKKNSANTDYIFTYLEYLDLSNISVSTTNYSVASEQENRIPDNAFNGKSSLTTVILPEDVVYIGKNAFKGTSISSITIPKNVIEIGTDAFSTVTDVTINSFYPVANSDFLVGFPYYAYFFVDSSMVDTYKTQFGTNFGGHNYSNHVYQYAVHIDNNFYIRVISEANSTIEIVAYTGDIYGTSVTPTSLEYLGQTYNIIGIGRDAYINMTNNQSITLQLSVGDSVTYIGQEAFKGLNFIASANTKLATSIGVRAFYGCDYLSTLIVDGAAVLEEESFANCTRLANVSLSRCIEIGDKVFSGDRSIVNLSIPKVKEIGDEAFSGCYSFESVVFGEIVTIGERTFRNCTNLQTVVLSSVTEEIGAYCFENCTSLVSIASTTAGLEQYYVKLDYLKTIDEYAFLKCNKIQYVKAPNLLTIGDYAFKDCTGLKYIEANNVTTIGERAFANLTSLTQISIDSVEIIGNYAFYRTSIQYVDIPEATNIGTYAFYYCSNIVEISFGNPTYIGDSAFYGVNPRYIDVSAYTFKADLTIPDEPDVATFAFGGSNTWHRFDSTVKYYFKSNKTTSSEILERKNYIYKVLETSYYKLWDEEDEYYSIDYRDNLLIDYIFEKDQFYGDWLITSDDNYLVKNLYLYSLKITEPTSGTYEAEVLSYHGKELVGNVVIPCSTYYPNGIPQTDFDDKTSSYYNGVFNLTVGGVNRQVTVTKIGYYAYENVDGIGNEASAIYTGDTYSHISFVNSIKYIDEGAFRYSKIDYVDLNNVEYIGDSSFRNTTELRYVDLGNCVEIGDYAFSSYSGTTTLWNLYKQYGHNNFSLSTSSFTTCILTKVVFRHVDVIGEGSFYYNYLSNLTFIILDFTNNAPGLDNSYNSGYGPNDRYNIPSDVNDIWRGYSDTLYYYSSRSWESEYNDINVVAPYYSADYNIIKNEFSKIVDDNHLFFDYGYTYMPNYKINDVEVGMFWLQPGNVNDPSSGFFITKSLIRNYGEDTSLEGLVVTNSATNRYMYTIPSSLKGENIYNSSTNTYMTTGQLYPSRMGDQSFKNSTVKTGYIVDATIGDGITTIPDNAFRFAQFKNVYLNDVTTLEANSFSYSSIINIYAYSLETIGTSAFYDSSVSVLDLRQNKQLNTETNEYETIYVELSSNFSTYSNLKSIYVNDEDLDGYVAKYKGVDYYSGNEYMELYAYIKALGTHIGDVKLKYDETYDIDSIISTYIEDENTESIDWIIQNDTDNKFSVIEGIVSVNDDPLIINSKYQSGSCDVYCIKHKTGESDKLLAKFHFEITTDDTTEEYYNIQKSEVTNTNGLGNEFYGYRVNNYTGTISAGTFNVSDEFNDFMDTHITSSDASTYAYILDVTNPEYNSDPTVNKYTLFEIPMGSYMDAEIENDVNVYLYTDKYITAIGDYAFYSVPLTEVWLLNVKTIGRRSFFNNRSNNELLLVVAPEIEVIEFQAFYRNIYLETVVIGDCNSSNLTTIGQEAFSYCTSLTKIGIISNNLTDSSNTTYTYYNMLEYISHFEDIHNLKWLMKEISYTDSNNVTTYSYIYYSDNILDTYGFIYLPDSCTSMGYRAFYLLNQIEEVRFPDNEDVTRVPSNLFESMKELHYVRLGTYVTTIGSNAFAYCENLVSTPYPDLTESDITIFENNIAYGTRNYGVHDIDSIYRTDGIDFTYIKTIESGAFRSCYLLDNLYLDSIESIASEAFMECSSLRYISFELNIVSDELEKVTFGNKWNYSTHELKRYYVSDLYEDKFADAVYTYVRQKELLAYGYDTGYVVNYITNPINTSEILGLKLVCYNGTKMIDVPATLSIEDIPYSILTIGSYAFHGYPYTSDVQTVTLPSTVTTVESHAFDGTMFLHYIEAANRNSSVDYGDYVFNGNTILIDATFTRMNSGGAYFFNNCGSLTEMNLENNYVNNVYAAPILDDDFFTGSPSKTKCSIMTDMNYLFTSPAYLGRIFEESEETDVDNLYSVKIDASNNLTILHYIGTGSLGTGGTYTVPTTLKLKNHGDTLYTVTKIGDGAFKDCDVVTKADLIIGTNIVSIGDRAFYNTKFGSVTFSGTSHSVELGEYVFASMTVLNTIDISSLDSISDATGMFNNDVMLTNVTINLATTSIPAYCFAECGNIAFINIGSALTQIGEHAFENCTSLKEVQLDTDTSKPNVFNLGNVTTFGDYAFAGCTNLTRIIAFQIKNIGDYCFKGCSGFYYPNFSSTLDYIGEGAFYQCTSLISAFAYTTYIPDKCYYGCTSILTVDVSGARSIGARAFYGCTGLTSVDLLTLTTVYEYAFYQCTNLADVEMDSVTTIGAYAFYNCAFSGELDLHSAKTIGSYAFANNTQLTKVTFNSAKTFGSRIFYNDVLITELDFTSNYDENSIAIKPSASSDSLTGINNTFFAYVPYEAISSYETAFSSWKHRIFERGVILSDNTDYMVKTVVGGYEIVRYLGSGLSGIYTIPSTINGTPVVSVGRYAFYNAYDSTSSLKAINLGTNVTNVERYAFYNFDFETLSMPNVETIGYYAFAYNDKLNYLSLESCQTIGNYAFAYNTSLQLIRFYPTLTNISYRAFYDCEDLRSVYFANTNLSTLSVYSNGYQIFGDINKTDVIIRVPTTLVSNYQAKLSYYSDRIKAGELDNADFSYREVTEDGEQVIEIIAYEGQATEIEIKSVINGLRVSRILNNAFENSLNLEKVKLPDTLKSISSHAFMGNSTIETIEVYSDTANKTTYPSLFTDNEIYFASYDGVLYALGDVSQGNSTVRKAVTLIYYPVAKTATSYSFVASGGSSLLADVNMIYENAFYGNTYITDITVPYSVRYVGENAFSYCPSLRYVEFASPQGGIQGCPTLYGTNIFTNCDSQLMIIVSSTTYRNLFISDTYFSYYQDKIFASRS